MTAIFPDSGVPMSDARNSIDPATVNCSELWYSTSRCQPRFDPAAANAVMSELLNLINKGEVTYDCNFLDQVQLSVRYLIQRGLPRAVYGTGGPQTYVANTDPRMTRYNNFLTITFIPAVTNILNVTLNIDGLGAAPVLRNDYRPLEPQDLRAGIPYILSFVNGVWFMCGLAASQVPLVVKGGIDVWIRTDGNDVTGDGSLNTPEKAYKTIYGAWTGVGSRFAASPMFSINMKFGIPGTYDGTVIGPFGGSVTLTGDPNNPTAYRIVPIKAHPGMWTAMWNQGLISMNYSGVTFVLDRGPPEHVSLVRVLSSAVGFSNCRIEIMISAPNSTLIDNQDGIFSIAMGIDAAQTNFYVIGNNQQIGSIFGAGLSASCVGGYHLAGQSMNYVFENISLAGPALVARGLSTIYFSPTVRPVNINVTGTQYSVDENSIINMGGTSPPGSIAGFESNGGRYIP